MFIAGTHQWGLTQQFASSDQVADGDVEIGVPAAPVGDLGEGVSGQDVLQTQRSSKLLHRLNRLMSAAAKT